jgi:hypothetical protein
MPNVKFFVDDRVLDGLDNRLDTILTEIRAFLMPAFGVTEAACHLVVLGVKSLATQTPVNIELAILKRPDRPRDRVEASCADLQALALRLFAVPVAIRCTVMEPEAYIVKR